MLRVNNDIIWINLFNKIENVFSRIFYYFFVIRHIQNCAMRSIKCRLVTYIFWNNNIDFFQVRFCCACDWACYNGKLSYNKVIFCDSVSSHGAMNHISRPNAELMLGQRRRRWPNIKSALDLRLVFVERASFYIKTVDIVTLPTVRCQPYHFEVFARLWRSVWWLSVWMRHLPNAGTALGQRRRRWDNIVPTLDECFVFAGTLVYNAEFLSIFSGVKWSEDSECNWVVGWFRLYS